MLLNILSFFCKYLRVPVNIKKIYGTYTTDTRMDTETGTRWILAWIQRLVRDG